MAGSTPQDTPPKLPPRWIIRTIWIGHRLLYRVTGGRSGLATPTPDGRFGMLRLRTIGRRSGVERVAILGYIESGGAFVTLAMNGWGEQEPAWLLNLLAHPDAEVDLKRISRAVVARVATGEERERLWGEVRGYAGYGDLDASATLRPGETAVVVLEPRTSQSEASGS